MGWRLQHTSQATLSAGTSEPWGAASTRIHRPWGALRTSHNVWPPQLYRNWGRGSKSHEPINRKIDLYSKIPDESSHRFSRFQMF